MTTNRCHARDARGDRCEHDADDHPTVRERDTGIEVLSHRTKRSWWKERPDDLAEWVDAATTRILSEDWDADDPGPCPVCDRPLIVTRNAGPLPVRYCPDHGTP